MQTDIKINKTRNFSFQICIVVQQRQPGVSADTDFQPIVGPRVALSSTASPTTTKTKTARPVATSPASAQQPSALPLIQSKQKISSSHERLRAPIKYEDNIFTESKRYAPKVVRYTKRRDAPVSSPLKRPVKRYHSSHTRPRRRPKPSYGPPNFSVPNPLNEYSLAGDIYDPAMYKLTSGGRSSSEKAQLPPGLVETDIGKFYDSSTMLGSSNSFKTSYKPFGTSLLSPTSLFGGSNDYKLGELNPILTNSEASSSGTYPASSSNFDASTFNLYQPDTIYPTAPQPPNIVNSQMETFSGVPRLTSSYDRPAKPSKPLPPSTSYGVPLAPALNSYAIDSSKNSYQIPLSGNIPSGAGGYASNNYIPTNYVQSSGSLQEGSSGHRQPGSGNFAEPPSSDVDSPPPAQITTFHPNPQPNQFNKAPFDAPYQFHIQQSKGKPISNIAPPQPNPNEVPDYEDDQVESSTNADGFSQPVLPSSYDQEQFEAFARQRRKILRQQQKDVNRFEEFASFYEGPEENVRTVKKTRKKPASRSTPRPTRPPPPSPEDEDEDDYETAPDEDYLDEIVGRPTKRPTRYRKKRPRTTSSPHVLDTDDLRDAFSSGSVKYSMSVKPDDMGTPVQNFGSKPKASKPATRGSQLKPQRKNFSSNYPSIEDDDMAPQVRAAQRLHDKSDQFNIISIQKSHSKTLYEGTSAPPVWHSLPTNYDPPNGNLPIQSRFDIQQRFDINDVIRRPTLRTPIVSLHNHNFNSQNSFNLNKHKYQPLPQDHDRSDTFDQQEAQTDNGIGTVNEEATQRTSTSYATPGTTLWDGKTMPKNHKMS